MGFFSRDSVRICALFGLRIVLCPQFCPYYPSFRTLRGSVPAVLSLFTPFCIRTLALALCPWFCPYYHSFRTLPGSAPVVLSLLPLFSDSARLCARGSVPITTLFGLCAALRPRFCPYYHSIRTLRGSPPAVLSLLPLFSDSARLCARGSVPITTLFGLCAALRPRFCPYYHSFRTLLGSAPAVLSLLPLFSDSARLCARGSVPITTLFGLCPALCPCFCPYYHSIRTQLGSVPAVLSESGPYLDSVELFSLKHCLNQTNLLNKRLFSWIFHSQVLLTFFKRDINGHFGSIIIAIRIGAVRRITFRVIFIIFIVVDK